MNEPGDTADRSFTRRTYLKAGLGGAASAALAGCTGFGGGGGSGGNGSGGGGNSLKIYHAWTGGDGKAAIKNMFDGFKKEYPDANARLNPVGGAANTSLNTKINQLVKNNNPPGAWAEWPGENLTQFMQGGQGILKPIGDSVWSKNNMKQAYVQGTKDAAKPNGQFLCVPTNIHRLNNLFYNKKVVERAGVDPKSLQTPDDFTGALQKIKQNTDAVPFAKSTKAPWLTIQLWSQIFLGQQDARTYKQFLKGNVGTAPVAKAFKTFVDYSEYFPSDTGTIGWKEANQMVIDGKAAFLHQGDWAAGMYTAIDDFKYKTDWDMTVFPGTKQNYMMVMDSWVMPRDGPSSKTAEKWLTYAGTKDAQIRFNTKKGSIPPRQDVPMDQFPRFQKDQFDDFTGSQNQLGSIAHGIALSPEVFGTLKSTVSQNFATYSDSAAENVAKAWTDAVSS